MPQETARNIKRTPAQNNLTTSNEDLAKAEAIVKSLESAPLVNKSSFDKPTKDLSYVSPVLEKEEERKQQENQSTHAKIIEKMSSPEEIKARSQEATKPKENLIDKMLKGLVNGLSGPESYEGFQETWRDMKDYEKRLQEQKAQKPATDKQGIGKISSLDGETLADKGTELAKDFLGEFTP